MKGAHPVVPQRCKEGVREVGYKSVPKGGKAAHKVLGLRQ